MSMRVGLYASLLYRFLLYRVENESTNEVIVYILYRSRNELSVSPCMYQSRECNFMQVGWHTENSITPQKSKIKMECLHVQS